jgi:hypothetical protein
MSASIINSYVRKIKNNTISEHEFSEFKQIVYRFDSKNPKAIKMIEGYKDYIKRKEKGQVGYVPLVIKTAVIAFLGIAGICWVSNLKTNPIPASIAPIAEKSTAISLFQTPVCLPFGMHPVIVTDRDSILSDAPIGQKLFQVTRKGDLDYIQSLPAVEKLLQSEDLIDQVFLEAIINRELRLGRVEVVTKIINYRMNEISANSLINILKFALAKENNGILQKIVSSNLLNEISDKSLVEIFNFASNKKEGYVVLQKIFELNRFSKIPGSIIDDSFMEMVRTELEYPSPKRRSILESMMVSGTGISSRILTEAFYSCNGQQRSCDLLAMLIKADGLNKLNSFDAIAAKKVCHNHGDEQSVQMIERVQNTHERWLNIKVLVFWCLLSLGILYRELR